MGWFFIFAQASLLSSILYKCRKDISDLLLFKNFVPILLIVLFIPWLTRLELGLISLNFSDVELLRFYAYHSAMLLSIYYGSRLKALYFTSLIDRRIRKYAFSWNSLSKVVLSFSFTVGAALTLFLGLNGEVLYLERDSITLLPVIVYFSRITRICFILFLIRYGSRKDIFSGTGLFVYFWLACLVIFILGRRSEVVYVVIILLSYRRYILQKRTSISRYGLILVFSVPLVLLLPIVRLHTSQFNFSALSNDEINKELAISLTSNESSEVYNVVLDLNAAIESNIKFNYGYSFINYFAHQFVSSAIFGESIKEWFVIDFNSQRAKARNNYGKGPYLPYLTHTIVLDVYWAFGSLGIIVLVICSWLFNSIETVLLRVKDRDLGLFWLMFLPTVYFSLVYDSLTRIPTLLVLPYVFIYVMPKVKNQNYG